METAVTFTKKELLAQGLTAAQVKTLTPVGTKKSVGRGRPAAVYSQEQVDAVKAGAVVAAVTVKKVATPVAPVAAEAVAEAPATPEVATTDPTDLDFAAAAA